MGRGSDEHAWRTSRRRLVAVLGVLTVAAVAGRILVFHLEWLYGETHERFANLLVAAVIVLTGVGLAAAYTPPSTSAATTERGANVTLIGTALAAAAAALAVVQLTFPATPYKAAAPVCDGAPVVRAKFLAQTQAGGVNARTGAGTAFPQATRFLGGCTLGFDGYCIGQGVVDRKSDLLDTRWLIVHNRDYLISSAKLLDQSPVSELGSKPHPRCDEFGGLEQPGTPEFTPTVTSPTEATLTATADNAVMIGYAVRVLDALDGYEYSLIKVKTREAGFDGVWAASTAASVLPDGTGQVELAAASCLAADVAAGNPAVYLATFDSGELVTLEPSEPRDQPDAAKLARTACSGPT